MASELQMPEDGGEVEELLTDDGANSGHQVPEEAQDLGETQTVPWVGGVDRNEGNAPDMLEDDKAFFDLAGVDQARFYAQMRYLEKRYPDRCWAPPSSAQYYGSPNWIRQKNEFSHIVRKEPRRVEREKRERLETRSRRTKLPHERESDPFKTDARKTVRFFDISHEQCFCIEYLLDGIALLLARVKCTKKDKKGQKPISASHVTAAMYTWDGKETSTIYLAKNDGMDTALDGLCDVHILNKLQTWFNGHTTNGKFPRPTAGDPLWKKLQEFWWRRHWHYWDLIRKLKTREWNGILQAAAEMNESPSSASCEFKRQFANDENFRKDFEHVKVLMNLLPDKVGVGANDVPLQEFVNQICFGDRRFWGHSPTQSVKQQGGPLEHFRKLVKYFK